MPADVQPLSASNRPAVLIARGTAHDHRNRVATLASALDLISARAVTGRISEVLALAASARHVLDGILDPTDSLMRIVSPSADDRERLDLNEVVVTILPALTGICGAAADLVFQPSTLPIFAECDRRQLENAIVNIVLNARDAMDVHGVVAVSVCATGPLHDGQLPVSRAAIRIADSGAGMTQDVQRSAFAPNFTTKDGRGSGLGLMMARLFADQAGGSIEIQSVSGCGTTVTMVLPVAADAEP